MDMEEDLAAALALSMEPAPTQAVHEKRRALRYSWLGSCSCAGQAGKSG